MKKLSKIKLQNLSQEELGKREQELLRGGYGTEGKCLCACVCLQNACGCIEGGDKVDSVDVYLHNQGGQTNAVSREVGSRAKKDSGGGGYGYGYGYAY